MCQEVVQEVHVKFKNMFKKCQLHVSYRYFSRAMASVGWTISAPQILCLFGGGRFFPAQRFEERRLIGFKCVQNFRGYLKLFLCLSTWKWKHMKWGNGAFHSVRDKKNLVNIAFVVYLFIITFFPMWLIHKPLPDPRNSATNCVWMWWRNITYLYVF